MISPTRRPRSSRRSARGWPPRGGAPGCWPCRATTASGRAARSSPAGGGIDPPAATGPSTRASPGPPRSPRSPCCVTFGVDPDDERVRRAVAQVRDHCRWEHDGQPFFDGEVEPCINGRTVALGVYFGQDVEGIVERLVGEQLEDGGWNCEAEYGSVRSSFDTTINVLEGLLAHERATGGSADSVAARRRGEEYLLERKLFRRKSTGEVVHAGLAGVLVPDPLALRRAARAGVLPGGRRSAGPAGGRGDARCSDPSSSPTGRGCSRTRIPARSISRSRTATVGRAGGTRSGRCVSCVGTSDQVAERLLRADRRSRSSPSSIRSSANSNSN